MTDEERMKLCADLRHVNSSGRIITDAAVDEIEQLAEAVRFWQEQADKGRRYIEANERERGRR